MKIIIIIIIVIVIIKSLLRIFPLTYSCRKLYGSVNPLDKCLDVSFTCKTRLNTEKRPPVDEPRAGIELSNPQVSHLHTLTYLFYVAVLLRSQKRRTIQARTI